MSARTFPREERIYYNDKKLALVEFVCKMKEQYDAEIKYKEDKTKYASKIKRHVPIVPYRHTL